MPPDFSPEEIAALLRETIAADRFSVSPRIKRMRAIPLQWREPEGLRLGRFDLVEGIGAPLLLPARDQAPLIQGITDVMPRAFGSSRLVCSEGCSVRRCPVPGAKDDRAPSCGNRLISRARSASRPSLTPPRYGAG